MEAIKDFLRDCYQGLTSARIVGASHRQTGLEARQGNPLRNKAGRVFLSRRHHQKPCQQAKQDQGADQREKRMQRVEMKIRVARETMPRSQHGTSFARASGCERTACLTLFSHDSGPIAPVFLHRCFLRPCVTPLPWLKKLLWLPAPPADLDCWPRLNWRKLAFAWSLPFATCRDASGWTRLPRRREWRPRLTCARST